MSPPATYRHLLAGPAGEIETVVHGELGADVARLGIICHPNPQQQGSMDNKVVTTITRAWVNLGLTCLRFNYRGVGASGGTYGHVVGEVEDGMAVLNWLVERCPNAKVWLAGFSFGAFIASRLAMQQVTEQLCLVAPAVDRHPYDELLFSCPLLVCMGRQDEVVPFAEVIAWYQKLTGAKTWFEFAETGHFFHGQLVTLRQQLEAYYADPL